MVQDKRLPLITVQQVLHAELRHKGLITVIAVAKTINIVLFFVEYLSSSFKFSKLNQSTLSSTTKIEILEEIWLER